MNSSEQIRYEVLVVGGGPAGLAAAVRAAESGAHVAIVDDNMKLGGQIWRAAQDGGKSEAAPWIERLQRAKVPTLCGFRIFDQPRKGLLLAESLDDIRELHYEKLVVATGA